MPKAEETQPQMADVLKSLDSFEVVQVKNDRVGRPPEEAGIDVERSGRSVLNPAAFDQFMEMVTSAGLKPGQCLLQISVGPGGFICGTPVPNTMLGAAKVTMYARGGASFQLHEIFEKHSELRPVVRQRCVPVFTKKSDGTPCMVLGLKTGKDNPKVPRKTSKKGPAA